MESMLHFTHKTATTNTGCSAKRCAKSCYSCIGSSFAAKATHQLGPLADAPAETAARPEFASVRGTRALLAPANGTRGPARTPHSCNQPSIRSARPSRRRAICYDCLPGQYLIESEGPQPLLTPSAASPNPQPVGRPCGLTASAALRSRSCAHGRAYRARRVNQALIDPLALSAI